MSSEGDLSLKAKQWMDENERSRIEAGLANPVLRNVYLKLLELEEKLGPCPEKYTVKVFRVWHKSAYGTQSVGRLMLEDEVFVTLTDADVHTVEELECGMVSGRFEGVFDEWQRAQIEDAIRELHSRMSVPY